MRQNKVDNSVKLAPMDIIQSMGERYGKMVKNSKETAEATAKSILETYGVQSRLDKGLRSIQETSAASLAAAIDIPTPASVLPTATAASQGSALTPSATIPSRSQSGSRPIDFPHSSSHASGSSSGYTSQLANEVLGPEFDFTPPELDNSGEYDEESLDQSSEPRPQKQAASSSSQSFGGDLETSADHHRRLVSDHIRPGSDSSPTARNIRVLSMMSDIKRAYGHSFTHQLPVSSTYLDCAPLLKDQLGLLDLTWWTQYDDTMKLHKADRAGGYRACLRMFKGTQGKTDYEGEDRIAIWSWWWHQLHMESKAESPDKVLMKQIWEGEKAKMANLPRRGWVSKRQDF